MDNEEKQPEFWVFDTVSEHDDSVSPVCDGESKPRPAAEGDVRAVLRGLRTRSAGSGRRHRGSRHHASQHLPSLCSHQGELQERYSIPFYPISNL